jgi:hypothetical protein
LPVLQADANAEQLLELPDGFARLLVHGLAEFHGLLSSTRVVSGNKLVSVRRKPQQQQQQQQMVMPAAAAAAGSADEPAAAAAAVEAGALEAGAGSSSSADSAAAAAAAAAASPAAAGYEANAGVPAAAGAGEEHGSRAVHWLLQQDAITCCDVIMALHELGSSFDQHGLGRYMKTHVHGSVSDMHSDDYVMV